MTQHTPGPWIYTILGNGEIEITGPLAAFVLRPCRMTEANARLIAKAPDMHEELTQLRQDKAELLAALKKTTSELTQSEQIINTIKGDKHSAQQTANVIAWDEARAIILRTERQI